MQKEEICTQKKQENRISLFNSTSDNRKHKIKPISRNKRKGRKSATYVNFLTTNSLKNIPALKLDYIDQKGLFKDGANPIDLIKDLYPILIEDISIFLHSKVFNKDTDPIEFLTWMLKCYEEIYPDTYWEIEADSMGNYHFFRTYDYDIGDVGESVPIDFMPKLKKYNLKLYRMVAGMLGVLKGKYNIPCYWEDDDFNQAIEVCEGELEQLYLEKREDRDEEAILALEQSIYDSDKGGAVETQLELEKQKFNYKVFKAYKPKTNLDKDCVKFIQHSLYLMDEFPNENFWKYIHFTSQNEDDGWPITPGETCSLLWNYDEGDWVANYVQMNVQSRWENYGSIPFRFVVKDNDNDEPSMFPYEWINVLQVLAEIGTHF